MANVDESGLGYVGDNEVNEVGYPNNNRDSGSQSVPVASQDKYKDDLLVDMPLDLLSRVDAEHDMNRIKAATALINTFNYAIQVQAKRDQWQPADYHRFIRALIALDSIGSEAVAKAQTARLEADVKEAYSRQPVERVQEPFHPEQTDDPNLPKVEPLPVFLKTPAPSRAAPLSSLPRGNAIRQADGAITDDLRLPRAR